MDEAQLWEQFRVGDHGAYAKIYERFAPKLLSYGRKTTADQQHIEDAIQDLFIELWKGRANLSPTTSIQFYLFRALRNKLSRRYQTPPEGNIEDELDHENLLSASFETLWIAQEEANARLETLHRAINQLSPRQQEAIDLRYYRHFDSREVAELMGINDQSVRNLLHTALRTLKQLLAVGLFYLIINWLH